MPSGTGLFSPTTALVKVALTDNSNNAMLASAATANIPASVAGYAIGCILIATDTGLPYSNTGTAASCTFTLINSDTPAGIPLASSHVLVGNSSNVAADVAMTGDITISNAGLTAIGAGKVLLAMLGAGITPVTVTKFSGKITWSGSGASLATTVTGVAATDVVVATIQTAPSQAAYLVSAAPTTNTITLVLSAANTSNDAVIGYEVFRAAS